ncbi:reticulon-4-interacting protein 1 homolog, mitochondrial-like [Cynoglossus semilaevis]|uniref:NAD(P)H oxidoreductase RTN4IP1, mitochondrial n=1 Tax=Cynoglossus semilaevis TaxID=244447 RepID=A0A3P8X4I1_CYNSE|nr:reticulon-4-interacting protein 1 homolog, mitochondrial-like [Cynoglossus semilaevis]
MASTRLLCLLRSKAAAGAATSTQTLARSVSCRRHVSTSPSTQQSCMSAWVIDQYGSNGVLKYSEEAALPVVKSPCEVMIQVHAASLNPLDLAMRGGYGAKLLKLKRDTASVMNQDSEFPLILGRDLSGVVVDCGSEVSEFVPGDEVWAAVPPWKQGSLAEYVTLTEYEVSHKPQSLSHTEAASIPYVASTALSALVFAGGLCRDSALNKRVLIIGGSGGVGTFSIQLLKSWGAHVTVTCSHNAEGLVRGLGADEVVDYTPGDIAQRLEMMEKFDVILDNVGEDTEQWAMDLLKPWSGSKYVTLVTPLLHSTDSLGLLNGTINAGCFLCTKAAQVMVSKGVFYRWAFYTPDGPALDEIRRLVDAGKILPVVEAQFPFTQVPQAFQKMEQGHARGKTVVQVVENDQSEVAQQNMGTDTVDLDLGDQQTAKPAS